MPTDSQTLADLDYITTKQLVWIVAGLFAITQVGFIVVSPSEEIMWQSMGWILSTNIAAVILTIIGNREVEKARNLSKKVYTPELTEAVQFMGQLKAAIDSDLETTDQELIDIAPDIAAILKRLLENKVRLRKLKNIKDDEVFMSAIEEVTRDV